MTKTYAQLTREIQALQAHAEKLRASEVKAAIASINELIAAYSLSPEDLRFSASTPSSAAPARASRRHASSPARASASASDDVKFSDGQGHTWGGRGPRPAWLRQAIAQGRTLESFATAGPDGTAPAKDKLPAVYGNPKTGHTWSGRGPKPNWLKQALKKRGASIENFLLSAHDPAEKVSTEAPAPAHRSRTGRGASSIKTSKGAAAGKSPASKAPKSVKTAPAKKAVANKPSTTAKKVKVPARKNLPMSMAPSLETSSAPSTEQAAPSNPASGIADNQGGHASVN